MNAIRLTVCSKEVEVPADNTLGNIIQAHTPYGEEAIIAKYNGTILPEEGYASLVHEGDCIDIYPLVIGG